MDKAFLHILFKITNDHIRTTERKYLVVTVAFIGLFSVLLSTMPFGVHAGSDVPPWSTQSLAAQGLLLVMGSFVYIMQNWYRAWKAHYLDVCLAIHQHVGKDVPVRLLPYWLRREIPENRFSVDNLLKLLTIGVNLLLVALICAHLTVIFESHATSIGASVVLAVSYLCFLYAVDKTMRKTNFLYA